MSENRSRIQWRGAPRPLRIGVLGATGLVGRTFLNVLAETNWPIEELRLYASDRSVGKVILFQDREFVVEELVSPVPTLDFVFVAAGEDLSQQYAPQFVAKGAWVVDNSSAFRLHGHTPLVVPEVNGELLSSARNPGIVANPNCTTIQLVVVLHALNKHWPISRVSVASYQAVSGAGIAALDEFRLQMDEHLNCDDPTPPTALPARIFSNCIPQIGGFLDNQLSREEDKVRLETRKILQQKFPVSVFAVRVPVHNAHAEAVWIQFEEEVSAHEARDVLARSASVIVRDPYPLQMDVSGENEVFVGRIHQDPEDPRSLKMWIVADNLRKGAATNALQITQELFPTVDPQRPK